MLIYVAIDIAYAWEAAALYQLHQTNLFCKCNRIVNILNSLPSDILVRSWRMALFVLIDWLTTDFQASKDLENHLVPTIWLKHAN